jgi:sugar lactone lactonase YvrE
LQGSPGKERAVSEVHVLNDELVIGEGLRWHDGRLYLSDWGANQVLALDEDGKSEMILELPGFPFAVDWLPDGRMLVISGYDRRVLRREADGSTTTLVDLRPICDDAWSEIVVDGRGNTYVNSIGFDFMAGEQPPPAPGVVALVTPDGEVRQVADGLEFPNGMVVTPDDKTLIVGESFATRLTAYDIDDDGSLSNRRLWAQLDGGPDGICMDAEGAIWTPASKTCIRVSEGGEVLQRIDLDRMGFACTLGGAQGATLFVAQAEWNGPEHMFDEPRTGQVVTFDAPAPHAGHP